MVLLWMSRSCAGNQPRLLSSFSLTPSLSCTIGWMYWSLVWVGSHYLVCFLGSIPSVLSRDGAFTVHWCGLSYIHGTTTRSWVEAKAQGAAEWGVKLLYAFKIRPFVWHVSHIPASTWHLRANFQVFPLFYRNAWFKLGFAKGRVFHDMCYPIIFNDTKVRHRLLLYCCICWNLIGYWRLYVWIAC